jgi:hypothetical protein
VELTVIDVLLDILVLNVCFNVILLKTAIIMVYVMRMALVHVSILIIKATGQVQVALNAKTVGLVQLARTLFLALSDSLIQEISLLVLLCLLNIRV